MRFLRYLAVFGISFYAVSLFGRLVEQDTHRSIVVPLATKPEMQQPTSSRPPREVVRLQVDALKRFATEPGAIEQCFLFASESNRAVTGPIDRFAAMVLTPGYRALVTGTHALVGKSTIRGDKASVLVTVLNENREPCLFRFFLSKQTVARYQDCWMTDAVISMEGRNPADSQSISRPDA